MSASSSVSRARACRPFAAPILDHAIRDPSALLLGALVSAPAAAQTTLTPFAGTTFGGETTENRYVYGAVLGFGSGAGVDIDFGYAPNFFGGDDPFGNLDGKLNITTLMFNIRFGGSNAPGISLFVSGGAGLMRASISTRATCSTRSTGTTSP